MEASPFSSAQSVKPEAHLHHSPSNCLNCGAALNGNFCAACGQAARLHVPSAREFLHEFVAHYVALEGKLWKSLMLLMFKPGQLTRDYIEGRRVRYVEPLRLYLSFSIIFFALFKLGGLQIGGNEPDTVPAKPAKATATAVQQAPASAQAGKPIPPVAKAAAEPGDKKKDEPAFIELDGEEVKVRDLAARVSPTLGEKVGRFSDLPSAARKEALKRAFFSYAPYAIFLLMPVFAAFLKILYLGSGRRYGEHVLFALHTNAFAFLCLSLIMAVPGFVPLVGKALGVWLVFYLPTAMRKVYGGSRTITALRWIVLMTVHMVSIVLAAVFAAAMGMMG